jgi:putative ABC transport system ATP-binding protein
MIETHALCKYYHAGSANEVRALDEVSLCIEQGSFTMLAGPSGSGKSTLLALMGALERPTRGRVMLDGKELSNCSDIELARVRQRMGFIFQDFSLITNLSAQENITYPLLPRKIGKDERHRRAFELLTRLGMQHKLAVPARELSGGEQQRVAIARALAGQPDIVLADEPTSALDAGIAAILLALFEELHAAGKTVVISSHDPQVIALADRTIELEAGRLKAVQ